MVDSLVQAATTLGVGAVFGIIMFWVYRTDARCNAERMTRLLEQDQATREENTRLLSRLILLIEELNKHGVSP